MKFSLNDIEAVHKPGNSFSLDKIDSVQPEAPNPNPHEVTLPVAPPGLPAVEQGTGLEAAKRTFTDQLINFATGLPNFAQEITQIPRHIENMGLGIARGTLGLLGQDTSQVPEQGVMGATTPYNEYLKGTPHIAGALGLGEDIEPEEVRAGLSGAFAEDGRPLSFEERVAIEQMQRDALRENYPVQSLGGDLLGIATQFGIARRPFGGSRTLREITKKQDEAIRIAEQRRQEGIPVATSEEAKKLGAGPTIQRIKKGGQKAGEAAIEGYIAGLAERADPLETAAYSTAAQSGAGAVTSMLTHNWLPRAPKWLRSPAAKLAVNSMILGTVIQAGKELTPGGDDYSLVSGESAVAKVVSGALMGGLTSLISGRHLRGREWPSKFPELAEAFSSAPRNTVQTIIGRVNEMPASDKDLFSRGLQSFQETYHTLEPATIIELDRMLRNEPQKYVQYMMEIGRQ
jgi:hypothetical protein